MIKLDSADLGVTNAFAVLDPFAGLGRLAVQYDDLINDTGVIDAARTKLGTIGWELADSPWSSLVGESSVGSAGDYDVYEITSGHIGADLLDDDGNPDWCSLVQVLDSLDEAVGLDYPDRERGTLLPG